MQGLIDCGRYKKIKVMTDGVEYEACLCIDVMVDSGYKSCLINTYKSKDAIRDFLPLFYEKGFQECSCFRKLITADGSFSVVFDYHEGMSFDEYFSQKPQLEYKERIGLVNSLLLDSLELDLLNDNLAERVMDRTNAVVDTGLMKIAFNYSIPVDHSSQEHFRSKVLGDILNTVFPSSKKLPLEIEQFIIELCEGRYNSCVEAYSEWREVIKRAEETLKQYEKEGFFKTAFRLATERKIRKYRKKITRR